MNSVIFYAVSAALRCIIKRRTRRRIIISSWQEVKGLSLDSDGVHSENGMRIAVDFYTKKEYSDIPAEIEHILSGNDDICIDDPVIDYEDDTGFTHYNYKVEVYGNG